MADTGLFPVQTVAVPARPTEATFEWILRPPDGLLTGTIYTDGSRLDGLAPLLAVNGWAFAAVSDDGTTTAIARGIPPRGSQTYPGPRRGRYCKQHSTALLTFRFALTASPVSMLCTKVSSGPPLANASTPVFMPCC